MKDHAIYIPSLSRSQRCLTLEQLGHKVLQAHAVRLVVPPSQQARYVALAVRSAAVWGARVPVVACPHKGIALTRRFIGEHAAQKGYTRFLMLDDDLRFCQRREDDDTRMETTTAEDNLCMVDIVFKALKEYAHVSISPRQGNNDHRYETEWGGLPVKECVRAIRALGFQTKYFNTCKHGRVAIMEDFDVALQLIARGLPNLSIQRFAQDQSQTQAAGGCSDYRTHALHQRNVLKMAKLWSKVVKVREKENKTGGEFGKRIELTVYWKKALGMYIEELT